MDISQTVSNQVASILGGNELYNAYADQWQYLFESYLGGEEYRNAGHLYRYQLETQGEYSLRLEQTPLENHCRSVIQVYNSFLFRQDPERDLGTLENQLGIEDFLEDCDHDGRNINQFMREVSTWSSVFGHCWLVVAKPNLGVETLAEELELGIRPYVNMLTPLVVKDWGWSRSPTGKYELNYFKYVEDVNGNITTVKEWTPDFIVTTIIDTEDENITEQYEEINQLGYIPVVCVYNARSTVRGIGISDIADIADAQKLIYNATSEAVESIKLDTHPSLVTTPETNVGTGAGAIIHMPENLDPGLKPYALEFSGASIESIYKSINHTIEAIDKMANTGAVRATESRTMSGVAMETEFQLLNARLSEKADAMELAEEQLWKIYASYTGQKWTGTIEYPGSFNIRDTQSEINQLRTARETASDPAVVREIDERLLNWLGVDKDEVVMFEPHVMISPEGNRVMAKTYEEHMELAAQGYTHEE